MKMKYPVFLLLALGAAACVRPAQTDIPSDARRVELVCRIDDRVETRADGDPVPFTYNNSLGLFICDHSDADPNPFTPHAAGYTNISAYKGSGANDWSFRYGGYNNSLSSLYIRVKKDDETDEPILTDFFAYAPYTDGITNPHSIPFNLTGANSIKDPLWCIENASPTINKLINISEVAGETLTVPLTFRHALAQIACEVTIRNTQYLHPDGDGRAVWPNVAMSLVKANPNAHLYTSGSMDGFDGSLKRLNGATSITLGSVGYYNNPSSPTQTAYTQFVPTQPGEDYADGDYEFHFRIGDLDSPVTFPLLREHIRHGTSDVYGFQPGYRYTFHFIIDNYVHFSGLTFGTWEDVETPLYEIEI